MDKVIFFLDKYIGSLVEVNQLDSFQLLEINQF